MHRVYGSNLMQCECCCGHLPCCLALIVVWVSLKLVGLPSCFSLPEPSCPRMSVLSQMSVLPQNVRLVPECPSCSTELLGLSSCSSLPEPSCPRMCVLSQNVRPVPECPRSCYQEAIAKVSIESFIPTLGAEGNSKGII